MAKKLCLRLTTLLPMILSSLVLTTLRIGIMIQILLIGNRISKFVKVSAVMNYTKT